MVASVEGHTLRRGEVELYYEVCRAEGVRTPMLLTHGYSASSAMWSANLDALSAQRDVLTWDMRGHGHTAAPLELDYFTPEACVEDMVAILDEQQVDRVVLGGLSLGGYLSIAFTVEHPERVVALCLFDTGPGFRSTGRRERWNHYALERAGAFEALGVDALSESPEARLGVHDPAGLALAARGILTQRDSAVIEALGSIEVPTLVLVGEHDEGFLRAADHMTETIPGAVKHVVRGACDASNIDRPDDFNLAVTTFLEQVK